VIAEVKKAGLSSHGKRAAPGCTFSEAFGNRRGAMAKARHAGRNRTIQHAGGERPACFAVSRPSTSAGAPKQDGPGIECLLALCRRPRSTRCKTGRAEGTSP
jgi:hypothetical protein